MVKLLTFLTLAIKKAGRYDESASFMAKSIIAVLIATNLSALVVFVFGRNKPIPTFIILLWVCIGMIVHFLISKKRIELYELKNREKTQGKTSILVWVGLTVLLFVGAVSFSLQE